MAEERVVRKLRAIISADVKGYSRLMGEDEAFTALLTSYSSEYSFLNCSPKLNP